MTAPAAPPPNAPTPPPPEGQDSLVGHLTELRGCLTRALAALLILMVAIFPFAGRLYNWLAQPLIEKISGGELISISVLGPFTVQLTMAFFFAVWLGLPYLLYEMWRFVAPGLYRHEKRLLLPVLASGTLLFTLGMVFAYFFVFQAVFGFIAAIAPQGVKWTPDIAEYFSFVIKIFLGFGIAFETPVVVFILIRLGVVEWETMRRARPYIIVGAFVAAAILTPPDVVSQLMLAIPCCLLYEAGLWLSPRGKPKSAAKGAAKGGKK